MSSHFYSHFRGPLKPVPPLNSSTSYPLLTRLTSDTLASLYFLKQVSNCCLMVLALSESSSWRALSSAVTHRLLRPLHLLLYHCWVFFKYISQERRMEQHYVK